MTQQWFHGQPQRRFDGSPLRVYAQRAVTDNPDSRHWENAAKNTLAAVRKQVDTREMQKALEMMSPDWFERQTWQAAAEAWQRVLTAATQPLDAMAICERLSAEPQSEAIPF